MNALLERTTVIPMQLVLTPLGVLNVPAMQVMKEMESCVVVSMFSEDDLSMLKNSHPLQIIHLCVIAALHFRRQA